MSKSAILSLVVILLVGLLVYSSLTGVSDATCEVCMTYKNQTVCRTGSGRTKEDAIRSATESACGSLPTSSMAERIECDRVPPTSVECQ